MGDWLTEVLVKASGVGRYYQQGNTTLPALITATFTVLSGDRIAVVGPSGSGKSTLLHLLAGLDRPTKGRIDWPALGAAETLRPRKIAIVFQMSSLLPDLTVVENVELPLLLGEGFVAAREMAMTALARIGLADITDKLPEELSGGQTQRVAMARAIAGHPKLILADEPTGQLDRATGIHLFDALLTYLANTDTALVVATHDLSVAKRMDSVWNMRHGVLDVPRTEEVVG
jgi:ABC-type lipoprotein export system ATPase subunit